MKVTYELLIQARITREEAWGNDVTIEQLIKDAKSGIHNMKLLLQQGVTEPVPLPGTISVERISVGVS